MRTRARGWERRRIVAALASVVVTTAMLVALPAGAFADDAVPPSTTTPAADTPTTTTDPAAADTPTTDTPATTTDPATTDPATTVPPAEATSPPVVQTTPAATVTPSTDLVNHQTVTVAGTGFTPNTSIGGAVCKDGGSGADDCDSYHPIVTTTDANGAFSIPFVVNRMLYTPNGPVDCASAAQVCHVGVAKISDQVEHVNVPIGFDTTAPLPPPPLFLTGPTTGLVEGQTLAVFGGAFVPSSPVYLVQCLAPSSPTACNVLNTVQADANGNFIATVAVHRVLSQPPFSSTDCAAAPGTCVLIGVSANDYDFRGSVPLEFDPNGPLPSADVTVTPDTGLLNFQSVTVAGSGFPPGGSAQFLECRSDATSYEDCNQSNEYSQVTPSGTFSSPFSVRRVLRLQSGDFDCASAPGACSIVTTAYASSVIVVATPLSFDTSVPPPPPPAITVTPDTDLVQGQSVTVAGSNFPPGAQVGLGECTTGGGTGGGCGIGISGFAVADDTGSFSATFVVRRGIRSYATYPPTIVDCASAPQACSVQAFVFDGGDNAEAPISFDPSAPIITPTVTVTPQVGLPDRALVAVHGEGYAPGDEVVVTECDADAPSFGPGCATQGGFVTAQADSSGAFDLSLRVHRNLTYSDPGGPILLSAVNCSDAVGSCVVRAESYSDPLATTDVPLGFDPTAVAPGPVITTTPPGPLADGQQVVVHGSGFTPGARLGLGECVAGVEPNGHTCDTGAGGLWDQFAADDNGEFTRTVTVHEQFATVDGIVDCATEPDGCVLLAANRDDFGAERVALPIAFTGGTGGTRVAGISTTRALAFTGAGSSTRPLAIAGGGALGLGLLLLVVTRRRRPLTSE